MNFNLAESRSAPPFLDLFSPTFRFDNPEVREAQEASWYARTPLGLTVLRYAEAQDILRSRNFVQDGAKYLAANGVTEGPMVDWLTNVLFYKQGDDHKRQRTLVSKAFSPRFIDQIRPFIRETATRLAQDIRAAGQCEFMEDLADPLPLLVMSRILGIPEEDYESFRKYSSDIGLVYAAAHQPELRPRANAAVTELSALVDHLVERRRAEPAADLISRLIEVEDAGDRLTGDELRSLITGLIFAGHDTTRNQLGQALVAFAEHADQWNLLASSPELVPQTVEEVIRWCPATPGIIRFAVRDLVISDLEIPAGTFIVVCAHAAQRDPRVVPDGHRFDITVRRDLSNIAFGAGPHYCLGAALARAELAESLPVLANELGRPSIAGTVEWRPSAGISGPERLPLVFANKGS